MTLNDQLKLSCYRDIAELNADHGVYLVQHIKTKRVYVKKILTIFNYQIYSRLKSEPIPGIPKISEVIRDENLLVVIEEYCQGETLQDMIDRKRTLSEQEIAGYMMQLCEILEKLHACTPPIIHRDIKPSNIILSDEGRLFLIDMNTAKFMNTLQEKDTHLLGTEGYAAPEQYGFGASTTQTDIYAVGMVMGELMNGSISKDVSYTGRMQKVKDRCIQINPRDRYKTISSLKKALRGFVSEEVPDSDPFSRKMLPPGFRSFNPQHMLIASVGYCVILYLGITLHIDQENISSTALFWYRSYTTAIMLVVVFLSCNYMDIQKFFPPCRVRNPFLKLLAIVLFDVIVILATFFPFAFMMLLFYS